jgi:hypothetical protein
VNHPLFDRFLVRKDTQPVLLKSPSGWEWFASAAAEADTETIPLDPSAIDIAGRFARCFGDDDGRAVLDHLQTITLRRVLAPTASDHELRHLEGQRHLVAYVSALVARGLRG